MTRIYWGISKKECDTESSEEDSFGTPWEFVSERVVSVLGRRQTAAPGLVGSDYSPSLVCGFDRLHCVHVVNAWVEPHFVHHCYVGCTSPSKYLQYKFIVCFTNIHNISTDCKYIVWRYLEIKPAQWASTCINLYFEFWQISNVTK